MAKSVGMARLAVRRWQRARNGWYWEAYSWAIYQNAKRYLRQHAQRHR